MNLSAPLPPLYRTIRDEWIDYNGHLNEAYYVLLFSEAVDAIMNEVGMDVDYRHRTGCSLFTVESHVRYLDQILPKSEVQIDNYVIAVDSKKIVTWHEIRVDGTLRATEEALGLHVDVGASKSTAFPEDIRRRLSQHLTAAPSASGRSITLTGQLA
jgi:acyl-CoA thioester hydrolase